MKFSHAILSLYIFKVCFIIIVYLLFKIFTQHFLEKIEEQYAGRNGSHIMINELVHTTG